MDASCARRSSTIAAFATTALLLAGGAWATPTFTCPGVRYIGNTSVTVPDPQNTAANCTTASDGALVAADGTFNAVTDFFLSGWTLTTSVFGQLLRVSNAAGITWNLGPMPGQLTTVGSNPGQTTQYSYDSLGRVESTIAPGALVTQYTYDSLSNRVSTVDRNGNVTTYTYDSGRPQTVTETASSNQITYTYNSLGTGPSMASESPGGRVTTYAYDAGNGNRLDNRSDTTGPTVTQYTYDAGNGNLTRITDTTPPDPQERITRYQYDSGTGNLTQVTREPPPPPQIITRYQYDAQTNLLTEVERDGTIITRFQYDSAGNLTGNIDDPNGQNRITTFTYDASGRLTRITDPDGQSISAFTYVPEPGSLLLLGLGLGALALRRRPRG